MRNALLFMRFLLVFRASWRTNDPPSPVAAEAGRGLLGRRRGQRHLPGAAPRSSWAEPCGSGGPQGHKAAQVKLSRVATKETTPTTVNVDS